jgi:molybdate transport system ATP-binding protein
MSAPVRIDLAFTLEQDGFVLAIDHHAASRVLAQDALLFPHLDVRDNVLFGAGRSPAHGRRFALEDVLALVEAGSLLDREVAGLSGGERQRVALARALMSSPDVLLLDEPLAAVDLPLRRRIVASLRRIRDDLGVPVIYVTHDPAELRSLADTVIMLDEGQVVQSGPPESAA